MIYEFSGLFFEGEIKAKQIFGIGAGFDEEMRKVVFAVGGWRYILFECFRGNALRYAEIVS